MKWEKYWTIQKKYLGPHLKKVILLAFMLLIGIGLQIVNPQIVRFYIDTVQTPSPVSVLIIAAGIYIGVAIIQHVLEALSVYLSQHLAWTSTNNLRFDLTEHCMNLDMTFHTKKKPGEMIERIDGDIATLSNFLSRFGVDLISSILLIIGILIALFIDNWIIGVSFSGYCILAFVLTYFLRDIAVKYWEEARQASSEVYGTIEESISGTEDVRANNFEEYIMKNYHEVSAKEYTVFAKAIFQTQFYIEALYALFIISTAGVFAIGVPLFSQGSISIGTIVLLQFYAMLLIRPIQRILSQIQQLQESMASIDRVSELFSITTKIKDEGSIAFPSQIESLSFTNLGFSYIENEPVLQNIDFSLLSNKKLGIVGKTGSGKTTLSRLLFRLYDTEIGDIKINNVPIKNFPLECLRKEICYVTQNVELFQASLRDNITFFDDNISDDLILAVIKDVGLQNWFSKLPDGLETKLISEETGLSAGEAQLLALTRAFLKNPSIVILDEASSRLDPATEQKIDIAVEKLLQNRLGIIIAHRLSTLDKVDEILMLDSGRILEHGKREILASDKESKFYQLIQTGKIQEVLK